MDMGCEMLAFIQEATKESNRDTSQLITLIGIIAPLILTCITIYLTIYQNRMNRRLQIEIYNRDVNHTLRSFFIDAYNVFCKALYTLLKAGDDVANIFTTEQEIGKWICEMEEDNLAMMGAINRMNLIIGDKDKDMVQYLSNCGKAYDGLLGGIKQYIKDEIPFKAIDKAWNRMLQKYGIVNAAGLARNAEAMEEFTEMCRNDRTKEIDKHIIEVKQLIGNGDLNKKFHQYIHAEYLTDH